MAQVSNQITVGQNSTSLLWQTSTGVPPDAKTTLAGGNTAQIYRAGTVNDPVPIIIENLDGTNNIYVGGSGVTSSNGTRVIAGGSLTRNVVGNDSEYAIATGGNVAVAVEVGRQ